MNPMLRQKVTLNVTYPALNTQSNNSPVDWKEHNHWSSSMQHVAFHLLLSFFVPFFPSFFNLCPALAGSTVCRLQAVRSHSPTLITVSPTRCAKQSIRLRPWHCLNTLAHMLPASAANKEKPLHNYLGNAGQRLRAADLN